VTVEIAIAGGGPAGATLAAMLARRGRRVLLIEKDDFPRDKLCGEFLSGESMRELDMLDVRGEIEREEPARIERARFSAESKRCLELELPEAGFGLSRRRLDLILLRAAERSGAQTLLETEVVGVQHEGDGYIVETERRLADGSRERSTISAELVICAHGRRQRLDRTLSRPFMARKSPYVGLKRHHRPRERGLLRDLEGMVEVHAFDGGYCGVSFIERGEVNVCLLAEERFVSGLDGAGFEGAVAAIAKRNSVFAERMRALEPSEEGVHAVAQVSFELKERSKDGVLFVGDAAGMIAPLAGDGQAMALSGARLLADLIVESPGPLSRAARARLEARWDLSWRLHFEPRMRIGRVLQNLLFSPRSADLAIRTVRSVPYLAPVLARVTRG
jgi:flavin-dependent dehydrogenase